MKYVIDEEDLRDYLFVNKVPATMRYLSNFLKSKKPVEEIAINIPDTTKSAYLFLTEMNDIGQTRDRKLYKTKYKHIKIYIEESEE
jgi:hypothetical protein